MNALLCHDQLPKFTKVDVNDVENILGLINNLDNDFNRLEKKILSNNSSSNTEQLYHLTIEEMERIEHPLVLKV